MLSLDNRVKLADQENFHDNEQYLEGTGIWESKGGIAIVISALRTLRFLRLLKKSKMCKKEQNALLLYNNMFFTPYQLPCV